MGWCAAADGRLRFFASIRSLCVACAAALCQDSGAALQSFLDARGMTASVTLPFLCAVTLCQRTVGPLCGPCLMHTA
eukprot:1137076-Pelagomonas_calceolata.AAC.1